MVRGTEWDRAMGLALNPDLGDTVNESRGVTRRNLHFSDDSISVMTRRWEPAVTRSVEALSESAVTAVAQRSPIQNEDGGAARRATVQQGGTKPGPDPGHEKKNESNGLLSQPNNRPKRTAPLRRWWW